MKYCISDIERNSADGDFIRRKTYREIAGCPLLFMADRSVRCFPTNPREHVVIVPNTVLSVLPSLRSLAIHPIALLHTDILSNNPTFKDTLHILDLSPQFIKVVTLNSKNSELSRSILACLFLRPGRGAMP